MRRPSIRRWVSGWRACDLRGIFSSFGTAGRIVTNKPKASDIGAQRRGPKALLHGKLVIYACGNRLGGGSGTRRDIKSGPVEQLPGRREIEIESVQVPSCSCRSYQSAKVVSAKECKYRHCACPCGAHGTETIENSHDDLLPRGPVERSVWIVFTVEVDEDIIRVLLEPVLHVWRGSRCTVFSAHDLKSTDPAQGVTICF